MSDLGRLGPRGNAHAKLAAVGQAERQERIHVMGAESAKPAIVVALVARAVLRLLAGQAIQLAAKVPTELHVIRVDEAEAEFFDFLGGGQRVHVLSMTPAAEGRKENRIQKTQLETALLDRVRPAPHERIRPHHVPSGEVQRRALPTVRFQ